MFKHILIPTDASELAEKAVDHGLALAKQSGARVTIIRVTAVPAPLVYEGVMVPMPVETIRDEIAQKVGAHLSGLEAKGKAAGVSVETVHAEGDHPWQLIIETAAKRGADLIVMASHGRRGLSAVLLGSETQKVLTHTSIPVLVVR